MDGRDGGEEFYVPSVDRRDGGEEFYVPSSDVRAVWIVALTGAAHRGYLKSLEDVC